MPIGIRRFREALLATLLALGSAGAAHAQNDLFPLSDEFESPATWSRWSRVRATEQWGADPVQTWDIAVTTPGRMTLVPETVTWYQDWMGPLAYQLVNGDFALTTHVRATGRDGVSVPQASFSLAGVMLRAPRVRTPATWAPGAEDYVFLSLGHGATVPATFQYEVKTTDNSQSTLILSNAPGPEATLQFARLGGYCIALRREPGGAWAIHHRYARPDLPDTLQAGLVGYTDWNKVQWFDPWVHNQVVLAPPLPPGVTDPRPDVPFAPDLRATFEYARFARLRLPAELAGLDLANPAIVPDAALLAFLGEAANLPGGTLAAPEHAPAAVRLAGAPNPARGPHVLAFTLPAAARVSLDVLDVRGATVRRLFAGERPAGTHRVTWDGRDDRGEPAAPGLYFARLQGAAATVTTQIVRLAPD